MVYRVFEGVADYGENEKQDANKKMKEDRKLSFQSRVVLKRSIDRFWF